MLLRLERFFAFIHVPGNVFLEGYKNYLTFEMRIILVPLLRIITLCFGRALMYSTQGPK